MIQEEVKRRLNSGNACYPSVQNHSSSRLLSKNVKIKMYKTMILPVDLYGCETSPLTLREDYILKVFENRVLRRIFGPKRVEAIVDRRKLHNEQLHNLYSSPSIIRLIKSRWMRWAGHVTRVAEKGNAYRILVKKPEGKRRLERYRRRWENNIKMDWTELAEDWDQ
jgi:hypothetical protein